MNDNAHIFTDHLLNNDIGEDFPYIVQLLMPSNASKRGSYERIRVL